MNNEIYPAWICWNCGNKIGRMAERHAATFHDGDPNDASDKCGWCGSKSSLTEPRDFKYPKLHASPRHVDGEEVEN